MYGCDAAGRAGVEKLGKQLFPKGRISHLNKDEDLNDLLQQLGPEMFEAKAKKLIREAKSLIDIRIASLASMSADDKVTYAEASIFPLLAEVTTIKQGAYSTDKPATKT